MARILTTARSFAVCPAAQQILTAAGHQLEIMTPSRPYTAQELLPLVADFDAMIVGLDQIDEQVINAGAPSLKVIARNGVGYDKVDLIAAGKNNVIVTITPGANSISACELAFSFITGLSRKIHLMDHNVRTGSWSRVPGVEIDGKTIGVLGTGAIGYELIKRCRAFGMRVLAYDLKPNQELIDNYQVEYTDDLDRIYRESNYISLHLPATDSTRNMINREAIEKMQKGTFIINTARGELIDEDALYDALDRGHLGGAGLDAFKDEPMTDQRFFKLNNVILTPHTGAFTSEASENSLIIAAQEVLRVLSEELPHYAVK